MFLNTEIDPCDHSSCTLLYDELEHWLYATWRGYIDPVEAQRGAEAFLVHAAQAQSALLLNDNAQLQGPWFDSVEWLMQVWVPQAKQLGLRYVAHVVQADRHYDALTLRGPVNLPFELQIFNEIEEGQCWLRECRMLLQAPALAASRRRGR